ncbi:hypothetical protein VMCG_05502 [Cytospora schulzeri]|uniref:Uncharacterized protein n=1 Tax=Cytospora schulzeri TaxID=448051 RepID=A0A423WEX9_9PEZI|nr:hypothetical protein VMCG_05502 [Valsa malicola]
MARYMGGPRGNRKPSPAARAPFPPKKGTTRAHKVDVTLDYGNEEDVDDQDNSSVSRDVQIRESIEVEDGAEDVGDENENDRDGASDYSSLEFEAAESDNDVMDVDDINPPRLPGQRRNIRRAPREAPMFPGLPIPSRNINDGEDDENLSVSTDGDLSTRSRRLRRRQRNLAPAMDIENTNPKSSGDFIFEPLPLPISYGWMVKGTKEHVEDLHLSGFMFCDREVHSKKTIEVLCEYTWIQATPSQERTGDMFPAIYVPGNTRNWQGLNLGSSLSHPDLCKTICQTIRDEHAFLQPQYPYEPTFRALEVANAEFSFGDVDIITDAETLTRLLAFICGPGPSGIPITQPFRLDLCTVRDTLFIIPKEKPGRGHAGPLPKRERSDPMSTVPEWAAQVLGRKGSDDPKLPYSGGHYRLVRYRFGNVVLAVRVKVDFVYEHRETPGRSSCDPLPGVAAGVTSAPTSSVDTSTRKTTVTTQGLGTKTSAAGMATVRYICQDRKAKLNEVMPHLWFSRTTFLVDGVVAFPTLDIKDASLINTQQYYRSFERGHRCSMRHLAGLLRHMQCRTRELGGNTAMICDPAQVCFVILKPVMETKPVPEDIVLKFWGPDDNPGPASERGRATTPNVESDLSNFSKTPTPPHGSDFLDAGKAQKCKTSKKNDEKAAGGTGPTKPDHHLVEDIDRDEMIEDWNMSVRQSSENEGYEPDVEDNTSRSSVGGYDGYTTDDDANHNNITMGESAGEVPVKDDGFVAGGIYQQDTLPEDRGSCNGEEGDEDYSGGASRNMQHRYGSDMLENADTGMERKDAEDDKVDKPSRGDGTLVVDTHQGQRRRTSHDGSGLVVDEVTTPGSSDEGTAVTASGPQWLYHQPCPESYSVGSNTETHGAATPHMD